VTQLADLGDGKSGASIYVDRNTAAVNIGDVSYSIDWTYTPDCVPKDGARFAGFLGHYIGWAVFGGKNRLLLTSLGSGTIYELDPNKKGSALHEIAQPIYNAAVGGGSGWNGWNATSCPNTTVGAVWGQGSASEVFQPRHFMDIGNNRIAVSTEEWFNTAKTAILEWDDNTKGLKKVGQIMCADVMAKVTGGPAGCTGAHVDVDNDGTVYASIRLYQAEFKDENGWGKWPAPFQIPRVVAKISVSATGAANVVEVIENPPVFGNPAQAYFEVDREQKKLLQVQKIPCGCPICGFNPTPSTPTPPPAPTPPPPPTPSPPPTPTPPAPVPVPTPPPTPTGPCAKAWNKCSVTSDCCGSCACTSGSCHPGSPGAGNCGP
jgi:hypothetical protein